MLWRGGQLKVNLIAIGGEARVQITDSSGEPLIGYTFGECEPFTGDALYWQPSWKEGRNSLPARAHIKS